MKVNKSWISWTPSRTIFTYILVWSMALQYDVIYLSLGRNLPRSKRSRRPLLGSMSSSEKSR